MALNSSRRSSTNKTDSIYREIGSGKFISIRTINELEDVIDTSEAFMKDPTVIFNSDNTKVLFYYNTKDKNEIEELETLFKRTVKKGSTITLSDASYLNELSGDDETYDISGTYKFLKYDSESKTIIAEPISLTKQSSTYLKYDARYWLGSLLWTTADPVHTRHTSHEIINFIGNEQDHSFVSVLGQLKEHDKVEVKGIGEFTVDSFRIDTDEGWERIIVKEEIPEKDLLGEMTYIRVLRSDRNQPKEPVIGTVPPKEPKKKNKSKKTKNKKKSGDSYTPPSVATAVRSSHAKGIIKYSYRQCENDPNLHWMGSRDWGFCMEGATHQQSRSMPNAPLTADGTAVQGSCCYFDKKLQKWKCQNKGGAADWRTCMNHPHRDDGYGYCWQEGVICRDRTDGCGCCCNNCQSEDQNYNPKADCLKKEPISTTRKT